MNSDNSTVTSRRQFLQGAGGAAAASALAGIALPPAHAQGSDLIQVALVGCGGRGTGAAINALSTKSGPIKLVAMADAYADRLQSSFDGLSKAVPKLMEVPADRRFVGFDAYRKALDCLKQGDVAIFTTPPAFRWVHFQYAIEKRLNVFMEKSVTVDGPTSRRMLRLADESVARGLKCGVGLMSRHSRSLQELHERVRGGEIGEILLMRGYRMHGPAGQTGPRPPTMSELEFQVRRFHAFLWAGAGFYTDWCIHIIDHLCWMKNAWPVKAQALGGRHYRTAPDGTPLVDQNFDTYSVEYTFADGTKMFMNGRCMNGAAGIYSSYLHGTRGSAIASRANDCGGPSATFRGQGMNPANQTWQSKDTTNPYQNEWDALIDAIRNDKPHNEVRRGVEASLTANMGRMAAHTGQEITWQDMLNCEHEMAPGLDRLTSQSPAPLQPGPDGRYPVPMPGITTKREY